MIDLIDPFLTFYDFSPEHGASDTRREVEALTVRQSLVMDFIEGTSDAETLLDCLEEQGVGADVYVASVSANVEHVIDRGIVYVANESGLLLPEIY
jgi:hypothetical protein